MNLLHLFFFSATVVNCSGYFWIFGGGASQKAPAAANEVDFIEIVEPPVPVIVLSESVDEDRHANDAELSACLKRKSLRRAQILAALPKEVDSMEMIAAEDPGNWANWINSGIDAVNDKIWLLTGAKFGASQYSASDSSDSGSDGSDSDSESSSVSTSSASTTSTNSKLDENENGAVEFFFGKIDDIDTVKPNKKEEEDEFQIVEGGSE